MILAFGLSDGDSVGIYEGPIVGFAVFSVGDCVSAVGAVLGTTDCS